jgi:hypothetical protein
VGFDNDDNSRSAVACVAGPLSIEIADGNTEVICHNGFVTALPVDCADDPRQGFFRFAIVRFRMSCWRWPERH